MRFLLASLLCLACSGSVFAAQCSMMYANRPFYDYDEIRIDGKLVANGEHDHNGFPRMLNLLKVFETQGKCTIDWDSSERNYASNTGEELEIMKAHLAALKEKTSAPNQDLVTCRAEREVYKQLVEGAMMQNRQVSTNNLKKAIDAIISTEEKQGAAKPAN